MLALACLAALPPAALAQAVTGDVLFERKEKGSEDVPPAIFQHWNHRVLFKCYACHNETVGFKMKAGANPVTMDAIEEGRYCGACHKGRPAFPVNFNTCVRCHRK
ncbi:MAG: hypothetical protein Fur0039_21410 [Rhodocyclaceae bacterium]